MSVFWKGLVAAACGGAAGALEHALTDPAHATDPVKLAGAAGLGAIVAVLGYFKNSPWQSDGK